jgi:maleylpyruvate isomerase
MSPVEQIDVCRASHQRLLDGLAPLTDAELRVPSLLPGYSRGHVVAHLINKVHAHIGVFEGAAMGEVRRLHPVGHDPDEAAEAGAGRSAGALRVALMEAFALLESTWDGFAPDGWHRQAIMMAGPRTMVEVVAHHLRNVEVHHVDLDIGYAPSDWPDVFVEAELAKRLRGLPGRADPSALLAWLLGRAQAPELVGPW